MDNSKLDPSLIKSFNNLYESGYRFIGDFEQSQIIQTGIPNPYNQLQTPFNMINLIIDNQIVSLEEKEKILNCIMFLKSVKKNVSLQSSASEK